MSGNSPSPACGRYTAAAPWTRTDQCSSSCCTCRHNLSQRLLAELFGCSQPTISRLITALIPNLVDLLTPLADRVAERELRSTVRVDGFLAPIGDRRANTYKSGMYSGKSHRCGSNVQVVASWRGRLVMDRRPDARRDARCPRMA